MSLRKVYRGERMESVFESIMTGLKEAVDDAKSTNKKLSRRTVTILPVKEYQADQVKKSEILWACRKVLSRDIWE